MGLMQKVFGSTNSAAATNSTALVHDGSHSIDRSKVLAFTDTSVISPQNPGSFGSIRSVPVINNPRYATDEEVEAMQELAKEKEKGASNAKKVYKAATRIDSADTKVHVAHRKYQGGLASNELTKKKADARLGRHLHSLRPGFARLGLGLDKAASNAETRISEIKAKLTGGNG